MGSVLIIYWQLLNRVFNLIIVISLFFFQFFPQENIFLYLFPILIVSVRLSSKTGPGGLAIGKCCVSVQAGILKPWSGLQGKANPCGPPTHLFIWGTDTRQLLWLSPTPRPRSRPSAALLFPGSAFRDRWDQMLSQI